MFKIVIIFLLLFLIYPIKVSAQTNSFVSVVNPIRGEDFWDLRSQRPEVAVKGQSEILKSFNTSATWLLRFDVFQNREITDLLRGLYLDEKGIFLEITPTWVNSAGVKYHESDNWHDAGSAFLSGYKREERIRLIDTVFEEFKRVFNYYPKSVGAWWIDSFSLQYMQEEYGITAALIVADQYTTDNYQIWGQYFSTPYYPSKKHALYPAQTEDSKLPVVIMQWASRDPLNGYGRGVEESTFSVQANDYTDYHNLNRNYFSQLIDVYTKQKFNKFGHIVVGLENSYLWEKYKGEYENQIKTLIDKQNDGQFKIATMQDFSSWYLKTFPNLSPPHLIFANNPLGSSKKVVWFMNPYYRAAWFFTSEGSMFRDIRQYRDGEEEPCLKIACNEINFATSATRVLDEVTFGSRIVVDEGNILDFRVTKLGENFLITYKNEAGNERAVEFLPRDIRVDDKISSIDTIILEATGDQLDTSKDQIKLKQGSFSWSFFGVLTKTFLFLGFLILGCVVPGWLLISRILPKETPRLQKYILSLILGFSSLTLLFYILTILNLKQVIFIYLIINLLILIKIFRPRFAKALRGESKKIDKFNLLVLGLIGLGTIFQSIPTFKNGLNFPYGLGFWGPNTHDGIWHISLINRLVEGVPAENPIFAGEPLKNYHYFYDLLIASTHFISSVPILDLVFRFYPIIFSILLGAGTYFIITTILKIKDKLAILTSLYLVYFAGSFGWIVEYIKFRHLGGESAFWANQSISFNLNPPFAISLLIVIAVILLLPNLRSKLSIFALTILAGTLISFKAYAAVLILLSFLLVGILNRDRHYILVFFLSLPLSAILFLSNFSIGQKLIIFSPFWFIHSMIDSPDRVGWVRLSLARTAGLEQGNWFKYLSAEAIGLTIFLIGNLGTRVFALLSLLKIKYIVRRQEFLFIFIFSSFAFVIPVLFIQAGNPWNTIQFIYYFLYVSAIVGGIVFAKIITSINKIFTIPLVFIFIFITPINSWATANGYLAQNPHAYISLQEFEALEFLRKQTDGIILTYPYDKSLRQRLDEPWPLFAYDSTAYVGAFSKKSVFVEDEPQNQILLTDYKKRLVASKDFFSSRDADSSNGFLKSNHIRYIYLPKIYGVTLETNKSLHKIFENSEVDIYIVD